MISEGNMEASKYLMSSFFPRKVSWSGAVMVQCVGFREIYEEMENNIPNYVCAVVCGSNNCFFLFFSFFGGGVTLSLLYLLSDQVFN